MAATSLPWLAPIARPMRRLDVPQGRLLLFQQHTYPSPNMLCCSARGSCPVLPMAKTAATDKPTHFHKPLMFDLRLSRLGRGFSRWRAPSLSQLHQRKEKGADAGTCPVVPAQSGFFPCQWTRTRYYIFFFLLGICFSPFNVRPLFFTLSLFRAGGQPNLWRSRAMQKKGSTTRFSPTIERARPLCRPGRALFGFLPSEVAPMCPVCSPVRGSRRTAKATTTFGPTREQKKGTRGAHILCACYPSKRKKKNKKKEGILCGSRVDEKISKQQIPKQKEKGENTQKNRGS